MAIQVRRGNEADFDASKMLPGEWAVSLDTRYVRMCFAPGLVLRMAIYESFEADMAQIQSILAECKTIQSAVQRIQSEVNTKASLTIEYSKSAKEYSDSAHADAERAKTYANNAEAVTGVQIATMDRAGLVKGGDNYIAEDGALTLIKKTTAFTMPNSYDGRLKIDSIGGGESKQNSTAGNQLFDGVLEQGTYDADLNKKDSEYRVRSANNIAVTPNEVYTFSSNIAKDVAIYGLDANGKKVAIVSSMTSMPMTFTAPNDISYIAIVLRISDTTAITPSMVKDVMLNKGTTALPYEEYTGGQPSPNPSYPQEIKKTVVSEIKTHGKNFLKNSQAGTTKTLNGLTFTTNNDGIVIVNGTATADTTLTIKNVVLEKGNYILNGCPKGGAWNTHSIQYNFGKQDVGNGIAITVDSPITANVRILVNNGTTLTNAVFKPMIRRADISDDTYEPYTESVITLSQPIDLYGMGDVQDVIEDGKVKRRFTKRVYNGTEKWVASGTLLGRYYLNDMDCINLGYILCTHAKGLRSSTVELWECYMNTSNNPRGRFLINTEFATVDEWKAHLASNPMTVVYERATETTEELPLADQIALNSLETFDGITYLEFDSEIEPTFKGEYGTSKVGGYTLEGMLAGRNGELYGKDYNSRLSALETSVVNNI